MSLLSLLTNVAYAQTSTSSVDKLLSAISKAVINPLIRVLFAAAFVYFIYGVVVFIMNAGNAAKRKEGQQHILWGIVGMAIMASAIGIVNLLTTTINTY